MIPHQYSPRERFNTLNSAMTDEELDNNDNTPCSRSRRRWRETHMLEGTYLAKIREGGIGRLMQPHHAAVVA